jgi:SAM-dependent methyltransferase
MPIQMGIQVRSALAMIWLAGHLASPNTGFGQSNSPTPDSGTSPQHGAKPLYTFKAGDPDGIGKWYQGRHISHIMGHLAADWLERPEREREENTAAVVRLLQLRPGEVVADIGAGTGYYSRRMAAAVGPRGRVLAVDIQPEMLDALTNRLHRDGITNVVPVLGGEKTPNLAPASVDTALLVDVYHELEYPHEMMEAIVRALRPGGRVVLVEFRANDPAVPIKPLHTMSEAQIRKEMSVHGLQWARTEKDLPWQQLVEFRKPAGPP